MEKGDLGKTELYERLLPVLRSKIRELRFGGVVLSEEVLFKLVDKKLLEGVNIEDIAINDLVTSIFSLNIIEVEKFINESK